MTNPDYSSNHSPRNDEDINSERCDEEENPHLCEGFSKEKKYFLFKEK